MTNNDFHLTKRLSDLIKKPISIIDLETTGLLSDPVVGIVELAIITINSNDVIPFKALVNPGIAIPSSASRVHGIYDHDVETQPSFDHHQTQIETLFQQHVIAGFNSKSFDIRIIQHNAARYNLPIQEPMHHLDLRHLWRKHSGSQRGKLIQLAELYDIEAGEPHRAMGDALTTARLLEAMIWRHGVNFVLDHVEGFNEQIKPSLHIGASSNNSFHSLASAQQASKPSSSKATSSSNPEKPSSKTEIIRQEILNHLNYFERLLRKNYSFIANRSGASLYAVDIEITKMFLSGLLPLEKVINSAEQALIAEHLEEAISIAGALKPAKPLKKALDQLTQTDIDYVQIYIAVENKVGKVYSH